MERRIGLGAGAGRARGGPAPAAGEAPRPAARPEPARLGCLTALLGFVTFGAFRLGRRGRGAGRLGAGRRPGRG